MSRALAILAAFFLPLASHASDTTTAKAAVDPIHAQFKADHKQLQERHKAEKDSLIKAVKAKEVAHHAEFAAAKGDKTKRTQLRAKGKALRQEAKHDFKELRIRHRQENKDFLAKYKREHRKEIRTKSSST